MPTWWRHLQQIAIRFQVLVLYLQDMRFQILDTVYYQHLKPNISICCRWRHHYACASRLVTFKGSIVFYSLEICQTLQNFVFFICNSPFVFLSVVCYIITLLLSSVLFVLATVVLWCCPHSYVKTVSGKFSVATSYFASVVMVSGSASMSTLTKFGIYDGPYMTLFTHVLSCENLYRYPPACAHLGAHVCEKFKVDLCRFHWGMCVWRASHMVQRRNARAQGLWCDWHLASTPQYRQVP